MSTKVIDLTEDLTPGSDTMFYGVKDPAGTPLDRKISLSTVSANITGSSNIFSKAQVITIADTENAIGLTVNQNDVTNNPSAITITNTGAGNDITAPSFSLKAGALTATGLDLGANNITMSGSLAATGSRVTKGWFTDLECTNAIVGSVTGNAGTVSTITGLAPNTATTAAAQPNITSVGTLTTLTVDDITINGNGVTSAGASSLTIAPTAGQKLVIDGHLSIDANAITGESDNNTIITAYAGKNVTIESVAFDGGDVEGVGNLGITGRRVTKGWFTDIESTNAPTIGGVSLSTIYAPKLFEQITQAATDTLTAAEVSGTVISNYGQEAENTQTLPAAAAGYNGMVIIGTAGAGAFHLKAGAGDKIYLDGTALDDGDKVSIATPAVGNYFSFWSFQTGASSYDWIVTTGAGTLTDGGA